ncbi:MAG: helix-hairpin-helix domain-containing protein [Thermoanaerobaculia bacterium]|nr:helix-hairpin-helix domain-containing protein [Thermoanaerobaculia bacterium]
MIDRPRRTRRLVAQLLTLALVAGAGAAFAAGVVNINTATEAQLTLLPRVGPSLASRIVAFREENGGFKKADDLILVRGIGERTFEILEPYVTVKGETTLKEKASAPRQERPESDA